MRRLFLAALPALALSGAAGAAEAPMTPDQIKQAVRLESVTIPMPGEFFAAIDKLSRPNWTQLIRSDTPVASTDRAQIALALGTLVADGYISVEAEDSQSVKNIGRDIINLAKKLNVSQSVLGRGSSINDFAAASDWSALREELEATQNEVKLDMADQKDTSLITLVTIGAWLRGTEIASGLVDAGYTPESARLLHQPAIISYLLEQLDSLPKNIQKDPVVTSVRDVLKKSLDLVKAPTPTVDNVEQLHATMAAEVGAISKGPADS